MNKVASITLILILTLPAYGQSSKEASDNCAYDRDAMLALDFNAFDQDLDGGWRAVSKRESCETAAADLIRDYHAASGNTSSLLYWHEGQMRAFAGDSEGAIELFEKSYKSNNDFGWNFYVAATIAFLEHDKAELLEQRAALSQLPKMENIPTKDSNGKTIKIQWPPNLKVVDSLIQCFGREYKNAYGRCEK